MRISLVIAILLLAVPTVCAQDAATVTIDAKATRQTWQAWGGTLAMIGIPFEEWTSDPSVECYDARDVQTKLPAKLLQRLYEDMVNDMGLTRFRLEIGPQAEWVNDNDDAHKADSAAFRYKWQDHIVETQLLPLKKLVEARGDTLVVYISYDLRSRLTPQFLLQPEEYAEFAVQFLSHLRGKYKIEAQYWSVLNEPGNGRPGDPQLYAKLTAAAGKRIAEAGFATQMSGPECVNIEQAPAYVKALQEEPGALDHFGQLTYHLYHGGANNVAARRRVREAAQKLGVSAAQTEWMEQTDMDVARHVYYCLTEADAVVWERYGNELDYALDWDDLVSTESNEKTVQKKSTAWHLWQFSHFIRPGDTRIDCISNDKQIKALAFTSTTGAMTVVLLNVSNEKRTVTLTGLPEGACQVFCTSTSAKNFGKRMDDLNASADGALQCAVGAQSVCTITPATALGSATK